MAIDPEMRKYERNDEWITCPGCGYLMNPLMTFEIQTASEAPALSSDWLSFLLFGWASFVITYVFQAGRLKGRQERLKQLKAEVLPKFPNSLVCGKCLEVKQRP